MASNPVSSDRPRVLLSESWHRPLTGPQILHSPRGIFSDASDSDGPGGDQPSSSGDGDGDDEIPIRRPKAGLAARLLAQASEDESGPEQEMDGKTAYQLMRERLLGKKRETSKENSSDWHQSNAAGSLESTNMEERTVHQGAPDHTSDVGTGNTQSSSSSRTLQNKKHTAKDEQFVSSGPESGQEARPSMPMDNDFSEADGPRIQSRLQELVAKKRAERLIKEEERRRAMESAREVSGRSKHQSGQAKSNRTESVHTAETDSDGQGDSARKFTQEARPTRKASKKALEEMNRETQRISRNQQLAHSVRTKKKIRKEDLFARFNFRTSTADHKKDEESNAEGHNSASTLNSAPASSDMDVAKDPETPPSSPPATASDPKSMALNASILVPEQAIDYSHLIQEDDDDGLPVLKEMLPQPRPKIDKGKAPLRPYQDRSKLAGGQQKQQEKKARAFRIILPKMSDALSDQDLEDDIEIVGKRFAVFNNMPAHKKKEPQAMLTLRALAHVKSPGKTRAKTKPTMTANELQVLLSRRARDQARKERDEKLDELRAKGVYIPTEEEKQKEQLLVENLLEKARRDAQELSKKEKEIAKNDVKDGQDDLPSSDEEYEDDESRISEEDVEGKAVELSGSEDENNEEEETGDDADDEIESVGEAAGFLDNEAEDSDDGESVRDAGKELAGHQADVHEDISDNEVPTTLISTRMKARNNRVVVDDDDDDKDERETSVWGVGLSKTTSSEVPDLGSDYAPAPLSMTQMFAATMDADLSQSDVHDNVEIEQDSLAFLRQLPPPAAPNFDEAMGQFTQDSMVLNGQAETPRKPATGVQDKKATPPTTRTGKYAATEYSEVPDPTQDFGFELSRSPQQGDIMPHSTVETVALTQSPPTKNWGRLRRKTNLDAEFSDVESDIVGRNEQVNDDNEFEISANAFDVMCTAAKKPVTEIFDRKNSKAKGMFEEQAEESEDEYAGLGGASDDESGGEDDEINKMMDDGEVKLKERELAAFYADKERQRDEKNVEKLYRDIANGGLRKKRAADFELSDSDDDVEARRRRKQREFARQRKALLQDDENLGKIAENPKKAAFFRAIEDHDSEDETGLFDGPDEDTSVPNSQLSKTHSASPSLEAQVIASIDTTLKRKRSNDENYVRPPAQLRRTDKGKKPSNLIEVRETLSFLIDDQRSIPETALSESEPEQDVSDEDQIPPTAENMADSTEPTRSTVNLAKPAPLESRRSSANPIIDRLSLKRSSSSTLSDSENAASLAFHAPAKTNAPGFKVPSLLRRATTSASRISANSDSANRRASIAAEEAAPGGVRRGGSKKSSINYAAREAERRSLIEGAENRRKEGVKKVAGMRRGALRGLGSVGGGFE
ncbi:MAG: hypothetical protein M1822_000130 [Bathelium mastoideum]|nr:MAG: hypothetical protein M1822_000130 [Bathelium mastoideum]